MGNSMAVNLKKYKVLCANLQGVGEEMTRYHQHSHFKQVILQDHDFNNSNTFWSKTSKWKIYHERKWLNPNRKGNFEPVVCLLLESMKGILFNNQSIKPCRQAISAVRSPLHMSLVWGHLLHHASFALKKIRFLWNSLVWCLYHFPLMYTHRMLEVTVEKLEIADHKQKELTEDISSFFVKTIRTSGEKNTCISHRINATGISTYISTWFLNGISR